MSSIDVIHGHGDRAAYFFLTPSPPSLAATSAPCVSVLTVLSMDRILPSGPM